MKKTKKLAALVLAMVMAFSLMAVTAAAYGAEEHVHDGTCCETEEATPRMAWVICPVCGAAAQQIEREVNGKTQHKIICTNCPGIDWT